jgi:YHS domain-containing protein
VYNGTQYLSGPVPISEQFKNLDSSVESIDAAFVWGANGKTYLFSGNYYWRYNEALARMDIGYPAKINDSWVGVPNNMDAAMTWINGRTYFFKGKGFWTFDNLDIQTTHREPMMTNSYWMKCREEELDGRSSSTSLSKNILILFISIFVSIVNYVV